MVLQVAFFRTNLGKTSSCKDLLLASDADKTKVKSRSLQDDVYVVGAAL
jgi:hypothetical protein